MKHLVFLVLISGVLLFSSPIVASQKESDNQNGSDKGPLTKLTFIHYKNNPVKPNGGGSVKPASCYGYLSNGARWKTTEGYVINPENPDGLSNAFIETALSQGINAWDSQVAFSIFGTGQIDYSADYQNGYNGFNEVSFGDYGNANVIAVTSIWGHFSGVQSRRDIVEWDMLFNTGGDWEWDNGAAIPTLMDLQNIATHELGHSAGMKDLYTTSCNQETMFGYSSEGEIFKRDLNRGDITGIQGLYK